MNRKNKCFYPHVFVHIFQFDHKRTEQKKGQNIATFLHLAVMEKFVVIKAKCHKVKVHKVSEVHKVVRRL